MLFPVDHLRWAYHGYLTLNVVRDLEAFGCSQKDGEYGHSASDNISTLGTVVSEATDSIFTLGAVVSEDGSF